MSRQRRSQKVGDSAEEHTIPFLFALGCERIQRIATPIKVRRGQGGRPISAKRTAKVDGDLRAIIPPLGRAVLVEVKVRPERLSLSDFEEHQIEGLTEHAKHGGVALVAWWHREDLAIMRWPIHALRHGKRLTPAEAEAINLIRDPTAAAALRGVPNS